ncbi:hypothetical protein DFA_00835 [Cavenderia fasciculata]|uniref:Transmembrane protein n=1 Tax=Cavenderia fasciculata TaxID=261658 RepID=F4PU40_CACFS|nr:uncharacterized protein DFA_00835 [Cavenderia fasciculata]EGG20966.1 hypothetical protein DFA_00835 [Cavenderia fasciculata]|eukprot:XP_004358816.1 hypothetical protein DFA_00835 [Cavenderia fasciculata]
MSPSVLGSICVYKYISCLIKQQQVAYDLRERKRMTSVYKITALDERGQYNRCFTLKYPSIQLTHVLTNDEYLYIVKKYNFWLSFHIAQPVGFVLGFGIFGIIVYYSWPTFYFYLTLSVEIIGMILVALFYIKRYLIVRLKSNLDFVTKKLNERYAPNRVSFTVDYDFDLDRYILSIHYPTAPYSDKNNNNNQDYTAIEISKQNPWSMAIDN